MTALEGASLEKKYTRLRDPDAQIAVKHHKRCLPTSVPSSVATKALPSSEVTQANLGSTYNTELTLKHMQNARPETRSDYSSQGQKSLPTSDCPAPATGGQPPARRQVLCGPTPKSYCSLESAPKPGWEGTGALAGLDFRIVREFASLLRHGAGHSLFPKIREHASRKRGFLQQSWHTHALCQMLTRRCHRRRECTAEKQHKAARQKAI